MDPVEFQKAQDRLQVLIDEGVDDLVPFCGPVRPDGLPQDWVDGLSDLTASQKQILKDQLTGFSPTWGQSMHGML